MNILYKLEFEDGTSQTFVVSSSESEIDNYIHATHSGFYGYHWHPADNPTPENCYMCQGIPHLEWRMKNS